MAKKHSGGIVVATGFRVDNPSPLDDRLVVGTVGDLTDSITLPNVYGGILVAVSSSNYDLYKWNGKDRTNLVNWSLLSGSTISDSSISASFASTSSFTLSSSFASTSSFTLSSSYAYTSSHALSTLSSTSSSFALTASHVLNLDISTLTQSFDGNRKISTAQIPELFNINPYENAYGSFNESSSSISDFLEAVFYPPLPNLPPLITSVNQISITEFKVSTSLAHTITAIDQAVLNDPSTIDQITTYRTQSIYTDDFFRIDSPQLGEITLNTVATTSMNVPGGNHPLGDSHPFYIEVGDARGAFTQQTLYIRVTPDAKPEFTTPSSILTTINEFESPGLFIFTIEGTDTENGVTFRTSSNNTDGFFNISSSNGIIRLTSKSNKTMNTNPIQEAYPLDIEILDQFNQSTLRTFYIKIKPNTSPIWKKDTSTGTTIENSHGVGIYAPNSSQGSKETIFAVNSSTAPIENDNITIETGSLSSAFTNDFTLTIYNNNSSNPSVNITQHATSLNANLNITHELILTSSDSHYQLGEDNSSVNYLTVNLNVTNNSHPQLSEDTQSFDINENTNNGALVGELNAFDPDGDEGIEEQPFIADLQLVGAYLQPSTTNITNSLGGTSLTDPTKNPFTKIAQSLEIKRKNNIYLNSDIANLYEYRVNIGGDFTGSGADIGILKINIQDHTADNTFNNGNWEEFPYIIESALINDTLKVNTNGLDGTSAKIEFSSGVSHTYVISSSNNFIDTPEPGSTATLELIKNVSESSFTRGDIIELEVTASQTDFPTTIQSYKYNIKVTPNDAPTLNIDTSTFSNNHTTNGALSGQYTLAAINYSDPDNEGDHPNFTSFIFEGGSLTTELDDSSKRYLVKSTANLSTGTYPFTASLKDTHGFVSSSIEGAITIGESSPASLFSNNQDLFCFT